MAIAIGLGRRTIPTPILLLFWNVTCFCSSAIASNACVRHKASARSRWQSGLASPELLSRPLKRATRLVPAPRIFASCPFWAWPPILPCWSAIRSSRHRSTPRPRHPDLRHKSKSGSGRTPAVTRRSSLQKSETEVSRCAMAAWATAQGIVSEVARLRSISFGDAPISD